MMELSRRSFLGGALTLSAVAILPPIFKPAIIYCDGVSCDADGLEAMMFGRPFAVANEALASSFQRRGGEVLLRNASFTLDRGLKIGRGVITINRCTFTASEKLRRSGASFIEGGEADLLEIRNNQFWGGGVTKIMGAFGFDGTENCSSLHTSSWLAAAA